MTRFDVLIIGGGIVGTATARALLARRWGAVGLVEAEPELARHQTGHNSGVIHSGLYYKPGSLKAATCRAGLADMYRYCAERGLPHERTGKLVVATSDRQLPALDALETRGRANGLQGLVRLSAVELQEWEPAVRGVAGLRVPETGIVDYAAVTRSFGGDVVACGGSVLLSSRVLGIRRDGNRHVVETTSGTYATRLLVNCAGLQSDRIARFAGLEPDVRIVPFRGEYYFLRPERRDLVKGLIYPVPDPNLPFLGVHFTRTVHGDVEAGPNAVFALARHGYSWSAVSFRDLADAAAFPGFWRMARRQWRTGLDEMRRSLSKARFVASLRELIPELGPDDVYPGGAGVRAQAVGRNGALVDDFHLLEAPGMLHVLNAPSPAATASLAIAEQLADRLEAHRHA